MDLNIEEDRTIRNLSKRLHPNANYKLISDIDCVIATVEFKKGQITECTGGLASVALEQAKGKIRLYDENAEKIKAEKLKQQQEIESMRKELEELKKKK